MRLQKSVEARPCKVSWSLWEFEFFSPNACDFKQSLIRLINFKVGTACNVQNGLEESKSRGWETSS